MHRFDANEDLEKLTEKLDKEWDEALDALGGPDSDEYKVYETIWRTFSPEDPDEPKVDYPEDFFEKSVEELNEHFGGSGKNAITEKVRKALDLAHKWDMADDDMWEPYEGEEEEEE